MEGATDLCCPMVASWIAFPAAACSILALKYLVEFPNLLIFILIGILSVGLLYIAITLTISFKMEKKGIAVKIASYISGIFALVSIIFAFVYFFYSFVMFIIHFKDSKFFQTVGRISGIFFPCAIFGAMQLNVFTLGKRAPNEVSEERESQL